MGTPRPPEPVTLVVGMLSGRPELLDAAETRLADRYGPVDVRSPLIDFVFTDYYEREMGTGLRRRFVSFGRTIDPGRLAEIKRSTNALEAALAGEAGAVARPVNLDPGYVCGGKLVLASTKDRAHRIYVGEGIYAEVTLVWRKGRFVPLETTYPDYRSGPYLAFFTRARQRHLATRA
jgi:hypothetical protein